MTSVCTTCLEPRSLYVCISCATTFIQRERARIAAKFKEKERVEALLEQRLREDLERKSLPRLQQDAKAQRIKQLQQVIEHEAAIVARERNRNAELRLDLQARREKVDVATQVLNRCKAKLARAPPVSKHLAEMHAKLQEQLGVSQRRLVEGLLKLYEVKRRDSENCWIVNKNIVLPDNAYSIDNDSEAPESLCAGLGYVVFVVASIARYLNVALPIRMYYMGSRSYLQAEGHGGTASPVAPLSLDADAYGGSGSTTTVLVAFRRALAFLDHNIKYLCAQQGVGRDQLKPYHIIPNLFTLIQSVSIDMRKRNLERLAEEKERERQRIAAGTVIIAGSAGAAGSGAGADSGKPPLTLRPRASQPPPAEVLSPAAVRRPLLGDADADAGADAVRPLPLSREHAHAGAHKREPSLLSLGGERELNEEELVLAASAASAAGITFAAEAGGAGAAGRTTRADSDPEEWHLLTHEHADADADPDDRFAGPREETKAERKYPASESPSSGRAAGGGAGAGGAGAGTSAGPGPGSLPSAGAATGAGGGSASSGRPAARQPQPAAEETIFSTGVRWMSDVAALVSGAVGPVLGGGSTSPSAAAAKSGSAGPASGSAGAGAATGPAHGQPAPAAGSRAQPAATAGGPGAGRTGTAAGAAAPARSPTSFFRGLWS